LRPDSTRTSRTQTHQTDSKAHSHLHTHSSLSLHSRLPRRVEIRSLITMRARAKQASHSYCVVD
jgi:hypothetical protein